MRKMTKKRGIKKALAILILAPSVVVAEYFFILTFALPYSHLVITENVFFLSLVGGALTMISLCLAACDREKEGTLLFIAIVALIFVGLVTYLACA